jgi:23S rRNA pseudouridine1911/1915/1917 synthase
MKVLYCDNQVLVAYKEAGLLSQEDSSKNPDILNMLKDYVKEKYNKPGAVYLGLVHRLDRNTSGVMVFARTSKAASRLSEQIREHEMFNKRYLAVVEGQMNIGEEKTLVNFLLKNDKENKSYISKSSDAKKAILDYKVLDTKEINKNKYSLLDINLKTGRHHQIRVQLANIGHPIAGDQKYGAKRLGGNSYNLSSYSISFIHPTTKESLEFNYFEPNRLFARFSDSKNFLKIYKLNGKKNDEK